MAAARLRISHIPALNILPRVSASLTPSVPSNTLNKIGTKRLEPMDGAERDEMPRLGDTVPDRVAALVKGGIGTIPGVGSILAEIIGQFIPNQRLSRIEEYLGRLDERLRDVQSGGDAPLTAPEAIDLIEEGGFQSARALSNDRLDYIARVVSDGLSGDERKRIESKRLLRLLGELDDDQIILLASYLQKNRRNDEFLEKHHPIIRTPFVSLADSQDARDTATLHQIARDGLKRLGLITLSLPILKPGQVPKFDREGKVAGGTLILAPTGRLLLRAIGLATDDDY